MRFVTRHTASSRSIQGEERIWAGRLSWGWLEWCVAVAAGAGLLFALGAGAAVLAQPSLFADLRPWWPPLAAVGLLSTAAGYWLLWGRGR